MSFMINGVTSIIPRIVVILSLLSLSSHTFAEDSYDRAISKTGQALSKKYGPELEKRGEVLLRKMGLDNLYAMYTATILKIASEQKVKLTFYDVSTEYIHRDGKFILSYQIKWD